MKAAAYDMYAHSMHESGANWATMKSEYPNIKVKTFPDAVMKAIREANDALLKESAANDPFAAKVLASQQAYLDQIRTWTMMSDKAYLESTTR